MEVRREPPAWSRRGSQRIAGGALLRRCAAAPVGQPGIPHQAREFQKAQNAWLPHCAPLGQLGTVIIIGSSAQVFWNFPKNRRKEELDVNRKELVLKCCVKDLSREEEAWFPLALARYRL
eukprot:Skav215239  [mRNA]  locus=scaffold341:405200:405559:+ [translate_table: standard]